MCMSWYIHLPMKCMYVCMYVCIHILEQSTHGVAITAQSLGQVRDMREQVRHSHKTMAHIQFLQHTIHNTIADKHGPESAVDYRLTQWANTLCVTMRR